MLRELTIEEMDGVSGGDGVIVVNGIRPSSGFAPSPGDGAGGIGSGLSGFQFMDLSGLAALGSFDFANWDPLATSQDDDDNVIVVTAPEADIVVIGPPRLAENWSALSFGQQVQWLTAFAFSGGNQQYADTITGTDISGQNPDNPYQSRQDALDDYGDAAEGAAESALEGMNANIPR